MGRDFRSGDGAVGWRGRLPSTSTTLIAPPHLTEAQFFDWLERQHDGRYELVDGQPRAMTGGTQQHSLAILNIAVALRGRLAGGPCRTGAGDLGVRIPNRNVRYPDVTVDCGSFQPTERVASAPVLVAEVLLRSPMDFDQTDKLDEYKTVATMRHILVIDTEQPRLRLHTRDAAGHWDSARHAGRETSVALPALDIALPLAELFEGLVFRPIPRLVPAPEEDGLG